MCQDIMYYYLVHLQTMMRIKMRIMTAVLPAASTDISILSVPYYIQTPQTG